VRMPSISYVSEDMFLIDFGTDESANRKVGFFWNLIQKLRLPPWIHPVPGVTSIGFIIDDDFLGRDTVSALQNELLKHARGLNIREKISYRSHIVPVCYDGEMGLDLEAVAEVTKLSKEQVIQRHLAAQYTAELVGFLPGFAYLGGVNESIQVARRSVPRPVLPAGSLGIAGSQCAIYPQSSPGGWNIIGRSPLCLFDPEEDPPCLIGLTDRVEFRRITETEFCQLWKQRSKY
jgi:inhibitor of KinA